MAWEREIKENNKQIFSRNTGRYQEFLAPVYVGDIIATDVCGANIIATKTII